MLDPSNCPRHEVFDVKGKKWTEKLGGKKNKAEEDRTKCWKVTWDRGVKRVARRLKDEGCRERNISIVRGSWRKCVETKRGMTRRLTAVDTENVTKKKEGNKGNKCKKWPFCLNGISMVEMKTRRRSDQQSLHVFLQLTILLFSLCPKMALSQVRMLN